MMVASLLLLWLTRSANAYRAAAAAALSSSGRCTSRRRTTITSTSTSTSTTTRLFSLTSIVETNISRLGTLQKLLVGYGAPGSNDCRQAGDLEPIAVVTAVVDNDDTTTSRDNAAPELVQSLIMSTVGPANNIDTAAFANLHPYLFPIAKSKSSGSLVCAYRNPATEESDAAFPWPIVESRVGVPGMQLLALNSEHLMRRIVCELDHDANDAAAPAAAVASTSGASSSSSKNLIDQYNQDLGQGRLRDSAMDQPYELGSVAKLGYGVEKYILLRVGPFPDLYQEMARQHAARGDEQSSLIAAETSNRKLSGFASLYREYARLLSSFPKRGEETRDAARMCLRLPLSTIGQSFDAFREVAVLGQLCDESDDDDKVLSKLKEMYTLIRKADEEDPQQSGKTATQQVLEDADHLLNAAILDRKDWSTIRPELSELFKSIGRVEMASFIEMSSFS